MSKSKSNRKKLAQKFRDANCGHAPISSGEEISAATTPKSGAHEDGEGGDDFAAAIINIVRTEGPDRLAGLRDNENTRDAVNSMGDWLAGLYDEVGNSKTRHLGFPVTAFDARADLLRAFPYFVREKKRFLERECKHPVNYLFARPKPDSDGVITIPPFYEWLGKRGKARSWDDEDALSRLVRAVNNLPAMERKHARLVDDILWRLKFWHPSRLLYLLDRFVEEDKTAPRQSEYAAIISTALLTAERTMHHTLQYIPARIRDIERIDPDERADACKRAVEKEKEMRHAYQAAAIIVARHHLKGSPHEWVDEFMKRVNSGNVAPVYSSPHVTPLSDLTLNRDGE